MKNVIERAGPGVPRYQINVTKAGDLLIPSREGKKKKDVSFVCSDLFHKSLADSLAPAGCKNPGRGVIEVKA